MIELYQFNYEARLRLSRDEVDDATSFLPLVLPEQRLSLIRTLFERGDIYEHVASLDCDMGEVFKLTQNDFYDNGWLKDGPDEVTPRVTDGRDGCRSTSVGDILIQDGEMFVVASVGFAKLGPAPDVPALASPRM